jgi:DNA-binding LytR/AlgR family response regulator
MSCLKFFKNGREEKIFLIKFEDNYYKILESQIAYIYKSGQKGFLIDSYDCKLPISPEAIERLFSELNSDSFFNISNTIIINRNAIFCYVEHENNLVMILKSDLEFTFEIPSRLQENFIQWFQKDFS